MPVAETLGRVGRPSQYPWKEWIATCLEDPELVIKVIPNDGLTDKFQRQVYNRARYYGVHVKTLIEGTLVKFAFYNDTAEENKAQDKTTSAEGSEAAE